MWPEILAAAMLSVVKPLKVALAQAVLLSKLYVSPTVVVPSLIDA